VSLNLMPTTGLTLPFVSFGRSSLVMSLVGVGLLLSIGRMRGTPPARQPGGASARVPRAVA
jgi:cell division protein FtsW